MIELLNKECSIIESGIFQDLSDVHAHLLPGVDDGVRSIEETLNALFFYEKLGVRRVCMTPHIMHELPQNTPLSLIKAFSEVKQYYRGEIELSLSAEYMLDKSFKDNLDNGLFLLGDEYILVETPYFSPPVGQSDLLDDIFEEGYTVILAHPERYTYTDFKDYHWLKEQKVLFQLNILSLTGAYGRMAQLKAEYLLENDLYTFIGTDIHQLSLYKRELAMGFLKERHLGLLTTLKKNNEILFN